jgi:hypothetical protein
LEQRVKDPYRDERVGSCIALEERSEEPYRYSCPAGQVSEARSLSSTEFRVVQGTSHAADTGSLAIRAVLMHHLRARRLQVNNALQEAVLERNAARILTLCHEAEATGVAETEIAKALAVAARIHATTTYETCPDRCVVLGKEEKVRLSLNLNLVRNDDTLKGLDNISTVSTVASESLADFGQQKDAAPAD